MTIYLNIKNKSVLYKVEGTEDVCVINDSASIMKFGNLLKQSSKHVDLVFRSTQMLKLIPKRVEVDISIQECLHTKSVLRRGNPFEYFAGMLLETADLIPDKVQRAASTAINITCLYVYVEGNRFSYKFNKQKDYMQARNPRERHDFYMSLAGHASDSDVHVIHQDIESYYYFLDIGTNAFHSHRFVKRHTVSPSTRKFN